MPADRMAFVLLGFDCCYVGMKLPSDLGSTADVDGGNHAWMHRSATISLRRCCGDARQRQVVYPVHRHVTIAAARQSPPAVAADTFRHIYA
jgi:hypothetical protein